MENERNLISRLNFEEVDVFLDGRIIFSVPFRNSEGGINLLGVPADGNPIYIGSGKCCYGPVTILSRKNQDEQNPEFRLETFRIPDFNVFDIIPARVNYEKTKFCNDGAILTTGYGCAGSGVRLIDTSYPRTIEVVSEEEFRNMWNPRVQSHVEPRLSVDEANKTISLNLLRSGYRLRPGKTRNPNLPRIVLDKDAEEFYISQDIWASRDLTPRLREVGVDVDGTIEANKGYLRIRH